MDGLDFNFSCSRALKRNQEFLNALFYRALDVNWLCSLFDFRPRAMSVLVFYLQDHLALQSPLAVLLQCCKACILECGMDGQAFVSGHDYFIFLISAPVDAKPETLDEQYEKISRNLFEQYGFQIQYRANELCLADSRLSDRIQALLSKASVYRYYGQEVPEEELLNASTVQIQKLLDGIERFCELGNVEAATDELRNFVQTLHRGQYQPMNVKRSTLRGMYSFFSVRNFQENHPYYDIPHFITEQLLKAETVLKTEQIVEAFCTYVTRSANLSSRSISESMQNALRYIHEHYQEPIKLSEVANEIHLNKSYLSQLFQKTMGVSYSEYLENLRIQAAKRFLKTTNLTAAEIAEMVGFSSQNYFTKVFKAAVGVSPIRFRNVKLG